MICLKDEIQQQINQEVKINNGKKQTVGYKKDWLQEAKQKMVELFSAMAWNG